MQWSDGDEGVNVQMWRIREEKIEYKDYIKRGLDVKEGGEGVKKHTCSGYNQDLC